MSTSDASPEPATLPTPDAAVPPPAVQGSGPRAPTTLVLKGRTAAGPNRDPLFIADVKMASGLAFSVVLFSDDLARLPPYVPIFVRLPDGRGGDQLFAVTVKKDKVTAIGKVDVCDQAGGRSVVTSLPEVVRDHRGRRWLRPQPRW